MQLRSFYKYNPSLFFMDTVLINIGITIPFQFTGTPWVRKNNNTLYYAFSVNDTCYYCEKDSSGVYMEIFEGAYPKIKVSEGNLILSYIKGDTVYRRIKYREREDWIREDFFTVSEEIENFGVTEGMVYDVSLIDTNIVRYEYDMLSSGFYLSEVEEGKWSHPYIFKRDRFYKVFTGVLLEDTTWYVDLLRRQYIGMVPSYYMEAESLKSPFTVYRDGYIDYSDFLVEYGEDSLVYSFPVLSVDKSYGIVIGLYHEGAGERVVEIEINGERDTVITGSGVMFWFNKELDNVSFVDLRIRRLSADRGIGVAKIVLFEKDPQVSLSEIAGIKELIRLPRKFFLYANLPNPFMGETMISYAVPVEAWVSLKIYDVSGRLVRTLVNRVVRPGIYRLYWRGEDDSGRRCASGVYFLRMSTKDYKKTRKMVMLR